MRFTTTTLIAMVLACGQVAAAETTAIQAAIQTAADKPPNPRRVVAEARQRLVASIDQVERFLADAGPETIRGWSAWLKLPEMKAELAQPQSRPAVLREISQRMDAGQAGLELSPFLSLKRALAGYLAAQEYALAESPQDQYSSRLAELSQCLARLAAEPQSADAARAGELVAWLQWLSPEGAAVARAVRARFCRQNVACQVSGRLVNALLEQRVDERQFLTDVILGTYTHGPAFTSGHVSFAMVPSSTQAGLEVQLQGLTLCPENVAQKRGVTLYSSASTTIAASKRVHLNDQGLELSPASARCSTSAQIHDIAASSRLVERLAWRRASRMLPDAEAAAARKAEAHSGAKLDERADAALGGINDLYVRQIRAPLVRQDAWPLLKFWTDQQHLRLALSQHNDRQLAPAGPPPQFPERYDLALAAHESMIENFCEAMLGGVTVKDKAFLDMMNLLTGSEPRALWVHDRAVRWSVTFADQRPLGARFQDDRLGLTLRLASVTRGTDVLQVPVEIEARLIPDRAPEGPAVARDGDVSIRFLGELPDDQAASWRTFLTQKFAAVFPPSLHFDGLVPPAGGTLGRLRNLSLVEFAARDGWTTLAYQLPSAAVAAKKAPDAVRSQKRQRRSIAARHL